MKQLLITFALLCLLAPRANAQSSVGVKADANLSRFFINEAAHLSSSKKAGGSAGYFYQYKWRESKAVQADMMLRYRTSKIENHNIGETADYSYWGVELPVYSLLQAEIDEQKLFMGIGPFASFGMYSRFVSDSQNLNPYHQNQSGNKSIMHRWDFGMGFIVGYELKNHLQFNFNFQMGFRNLVDEGFEGVDMISQLVGLGVGYSF